MKGCSIESSYRNKLVRNRYEGKQTDRDGNCSAWPPVLILPAAVAGRVRDGRGRLSLDRVVLIGEDTVHWSQETNVDLRTNRGASYPAESWHRFNRSYLGKIRDETGFSNHSTENTITGSFTRITCRCRFPCSRFFEREGPAMFHGTHNGEYTPEQGSETRSSQTNNSVPGFMRVVGILFYGVHTEAPNPIVYRCTPLPPSSRRRGV